MKKLISLSMIVLMLTIPIITAQELTITRFSGNDNATGYARSRDYLRIEALAQIPGEDIIDNQQLRIYIDNSFGFFDSCVKEGAYHRCRFEDPDFEWYAPLPFNIELWDDDNRRVANRSATLGIDNIAPVVKEFRAEPSATTGNVAFTYLVEDYGLAFGIPQGCSGIKEVLFVQRGNTLVAETGAPGICSKSRSFNFALNESGSVCLKARDFLNRESPSVCKTIIVDKTSPVIQNLVISDAQGNTLTHLHRGEEKIATITVQITDDSQVNRNEVSADFGALSSRSGFIAPETVANNLYIWRNIPVRESSNCKVAVRARDILGNSQTVDFQCTMASDNTPPTIKGLAPVNWRDSKPVFGKNYLIVEFEDKDDQGSAGSGFDRANAFVDLQSLGGGRFVKADYCTSLGSVWSCFWLLNFNVEEKEYDISVSGSDDLDNAVASPQRFTIIYDSTPPAAPQLIETRTIGGSVNATPIEGNFLQFVLRSSGFVHAFANMSDLGGSEEKQAQSCTELQTTNQQPQTKECVFENRIDFAGPYTADVGFTFVDDAGNKAGTSTSVDIFGVENASASYWRANVTCTPDLIDRGAASVIPPYISCKIALKSQRRDISPLIIQGPQSPDDCSGSAASSITDAYLTNNIPGSREPYLILRLASQNYETNSLNISCPLSILSKREARVNQSRQGYVSPVPQNLNVNLSLQFYNVPNRDMYGEVDRQIKKAMDNSFANAEWLGDLRKFLNYADTLCNVKVIITNTIGVLFSLATMLGIIAGAIESTFVGIGPAQPVEASKKLLCHSEEVLSEKYGGFNGLIEFLDSICSVTNCNAAQGGKGEWSLQGVAGGGAPWCSNVNEFFKETSLGSAQQESVRVGTGREFGANATIPAFNIKDSLSLSTACFCLPGIVYNLEKLRQVNCFKAVCLNDDVKEQGYPVSYCNEMEHYLLCQYVIGEMFAWIPFSQFFERLLDMLLEIITDPIALFTTAIGGICEGTCYVEFDSSVAYIACATFKTTSVIAESVASFTEMSKTKHYFSQAPGGEYCRRMERIEKEMDEDK